MSLTFDWRQKLVFPILVVGLLGCCVFANAQTSASSCAPKEKSDWERDGLRGRVRFMRTYRTVFKRSDKSGKFLEQRSVLDEEKVAYDSYGNRNGGGEVIHVPSGKELASISYVCDEQSRVREIRFVAKDGTSYSRTGYLYDQKGRAKEKSDYFPDGSLERKETYTYDVAGNLIEENDKQEVHPEHFTPKRYDVYVTTKATFKYDARKNKIEEKHFYPDGSLYATWIHKYDSKDRLIKETRTDKRGRLEDQFFYGYDRAGKLLTEFHYANFCYEKDGNFCRGNVNSGDGIFYYATKTTYKYDRRGNWAKQSEFTRGGERDTGAWAPSSVLYREISY